MIIIVQKNAELHDALNSLFPVDQFGLDKLMITHKSHLSYTWKTHFCYLEENEKAKLSKQ